MMEDILVQVQINPANIDMLNRILEGAGHMGVMSTLDRQQGLVVIRATDGTAPDLVDLVARLPFPVNIVSLQGVDRDLITEK